MALSLPWFLDLGTGELVKKRFSVELEGPGLASSRFHVLGLEAQDLPEEEIMVALDQDWSRLEVRMLHTLAAAERALWLLKGWTGLEGRWTPYPELPLLLYSHSREVESFDAAWAFFGEYAPHQMAIHFEYVMGDPWLSACLSHDLVVHEVCHAFLDGSKGWLHATEETAALTESLGDVLAMLSAGRLVEARRRALLETNGQLGGRSNVLSRFAELPGYSKVLRDISTPTTRSQVEAAHPVPSRERIYALATVLSSALYQAMVRRFHSLGKEEAHLLTALSELATVVFGILPELPNGQVSFAQFADLLNAVVEDPLGAFLAEQFLAQEVV